MTSKQPKKRVVESPPDNRDSTSEIQKLLSDTEWLIDKWENIVRRTGRYNPAVNDNTVSDLIAVLNLAKVLGPWSKSHIDNLQDNPQKGCIRDIVLTAYLAVYQKITDIAEKQDWHVDVPARESDPFEGFTTLQEWCSSEKKKNHTYRDKSSEPDKELHDQMSALNEKVDERENVMQLL